MSSENGAKGTSLRLPTRRKAANLALFIGFLVLVYTFLLPSSSLSHGSNGWPIGIREKGEEYVEFSPLELPKKITGVDGPAPDIQIAVLEHAGFHDEVVGALLKTLEDIGANYTVYRDGWRWHFDTVLKPFLPSLPAPIHRGSFGDHAKDERFDMVIHTSCDYSWRDRMPDYIAEAFLIRPKMHVLCIQHELEKLETKERDIWSSVVDEGRFTLMTLSPHTSKELSRYVMKWEFETGDPAWRNVSVETLIPIFPVDPEKIAIREDSLVPLSPPKVAGSIPSRIAILGSIMPHRRNFQEVINHLYKAISENPSLWGYKLDKGSNTFVSANDPNIPPATLHLVGDKPDNVGVHIAPEMVDVVNIQSGLDYDDFYRLIATMDLIVPAFRDFVYVDHKLSSAIPAGIISRVPILADPLLLDAYTFLRSPALILQPSSMNEVEAIGKLRQGLDPMQGEKVVLPGYKGFNGAAPRSEWDAYHKRLYQYNERVMRRLIGEVSGRLKAYKEVEVGKE